MLSRCVDCVVASSHNKKPSVQLKNLLEQEMIEPMMVASRAEGGGDGMEELTTLFAEQNLHQMPVERIKAVPAEERSLALNDLHAVADPIIETPELLATKLQELDVEASSIQGTGALEEAIRQSAEYVDSWKLRFLRAERFNSAYAAARMVRHFETKRAMFGQKALGRDVHLTDLSSEELAAMKTGYVQALSQRDRAGRAVIAEMDVVEERWPVEISTKLTFLIASMVSEEEAVQKDGVVMIFYSVGRKSVYHDRAVQEVENYLSLPLRLVALHDCYDNSQLHSVMSIASHAMESKYLCRHRCHYGTHAACQANLALFGIPKHTIPLYPDGTIDCTHHNRWMKQAMSKTAVVHSPERIMLAGPNDVIMGRGQRKHEGNLRLRQCVEDRFFQYQKATWMDKRSICESLYNHLTEAGTRFITFTADGYWERISEDAAMDKIAHVFRDFRRELRRLQAK